MQTDSVKSKAGHVKFNNLYSMSHCYMPHVASRYYQTFLFLQGLVGGWIIVQRQAPED
jgi:hypothetical protein